MKRQSKTESIKIKFPQLKSFTVRKRKQLHSVADVPDNVYLCKTCQFIAKSKEALAMHNNTFHKPSIGADTKRKIFNCGKCEYKTDYSKLYDTHLVYHLKGSMAHHENPSTLQCTICQFSAVDRSFLSNHMVEAHSHFNCQMCDFFSNFEYVLNGHVLLCHSNPLHNSEEKYLESPSETKSFKVNKSGYLASSQSNLTYPIASSQGQQGGQLSSVILLPPYEWSLLRHITCDSLSLQNNAADGLCDSEVLDSFKTSQVLKN